MKITEPAQRLAPQRIPFVQVAFKRASMPSLGQHHAAQYFLHRRTLPSHGHVGCRCQHGGAGGGFALPPCEAGHRRRYNAGLGQSLSRFQSMERLATGPGCGGDARCILANDESRELRQIGVVDAHGLSASWTGADCTPWCGHVTGSDFAIQGNMLTGPEVIAEMERAFLGSEASELAERLVLALEAGQAVGGDKRGKQSAALLVL